jgi:hypothetical protein
MIKVGELLIIYHEGVATLVEITTTLGGLMGKDVYGDLYMIRQREDGRYIGDNGR